MSIKFVLRADELLLWECGSKLLSKLRNTSYLSRKIKQREDDLLLQLQDIRIHYFLRDDFNLKTLSHVLGPTETVFSSYETKSKVNTIDMYK